MSTLSRAILLVLLSLCLASPSSAVPPEGKGGKDREPGPVRVLADGVSIGTFLQSWASGGYMHISALSSESYRFEVRANTLPGYGDSVGDLSTGNIYYESSDCTGPAYVLVTAGMFDNDSHFSAAQGFVFLVANSNLNEGHYYVPAGSQPASRNFQAQGPGCSTYILANRESVEAFPNDPTITGVPNEPFTPPITLGY